MVELPDDAFRAARDGRTATLEARGVCVVDSFQFLVPNNVGATVSFSVRWEATDPAVRRGRGSEDPPPTRRRSWPDRAGPVDRLVLRVGGGVQLPVQPGVSTDRGYALMGRERNGAFLG